MTVKVVINSRFQHRRVTGVERYAQEISKRLIPAPRFVSPKMAMGQIGGHFWEQFVLPAQIRKDEILWSPANAGPWIVNKQVVTLHDASVFDHPEWFRPFFAAWTRLSWKILAKRVEAIITVSNFSRERLKFHLGIPDEKIHVISNGVGSPFELQTQIAIEEIKTKYNLHKPYFLFVGTIEPRKNLQTLMQAWERLNSKSHSLFIAGAEGKVFSKNKDFTVNAVYVPDCDLPALYAGATATIIPSFYEGFGLTALEAMACGAPVIASSTTAFPETTGNAALLFDPHNSNELVEAMKIMIENKSLANTLRERGLQRSAPFTWDESARKTSEVLLDIS